MNENIAPERKKTIERIAKNPLLFLLQNKEKGCTEAIKFLITVRKEIKTDSVYSISNPHPYFKDFVLADNSAVVFYTSLFSLLKDTGYDANEVKAACMDVFPTSTHDGSLHGAEVVNKFFELVESALDIVYERN